LFTQVVLALRLFHPRLGIRLYLLAQFEDFDLPTEYTHQPAQLVLHAVQFQDLLAHGQIHASVRGDHVRELPGILRLEGAGGHFVRQVGGQAYQLAELVQDAALQRLEF